MMNRGIHIAASAVILLLGLALSKPVQSMGLGEARVDSFLNQPLDVQVRLLEVSQADLDSLSVQIGSAGDYERLGLMGDVLGLDVSVSIDRGQSPPVLRVRSQRPARDPVVQLLVDARWSSGRILREYTLFLDPPTITTAPPPRTQPEAATSPSPAPVRTVTPAQESTPAVAPQPVPAAPAPARMQGDDQYVVQRGDTLWSVAQNTRPDTQLSMNQTMLAIVEMNPTAFLNGNVHQMLSGAELDLPGREQISSIDAQMAEQTIAEQNRAFNQRLNAAVPVLAEENPPLAETESEAADETRSDETEPSTAVPETEFVDQTPANDASATASSEEFRLELVPPDEDESGLGLSEEEREANRLRQQLAREEEELFTAQLEAEQLRERLDELETMVNDNPSGVGIRDFDLAQFEQTLRDARLAASEQADPALRAEMSDQVEQYLQQFAALPEADSELQSASEQTELADDTAPVVTQISEPRSGLAGWFSNPIVLFVLVLLIVLIGLAIVWLRFKRSAEPEVKEATPTPPAEVRSEPSMSSELDLMERVREQPENLDQHLQSLELLAGRDDPDAFSNELERMYNQVEFDEQPQWQQALKLAGQVIPDHPLVLGSMDWDPDSGNTEDELQPDADNNDLLDIEGMLTDDERAQVSTFDEVPEQSGQPAEDSSPVTQATNTGVDDLDSPFLHEDDREGDWEPGIEDKSISLDEVVTANEFEAKRIADNTEDEIAESAPLSFDWPEASEGDTTEKDDVASVDDEQAEVLASEDEVEQDQDDIFTTSDDDVDVKLDLARAYLSWNSVDSARTLLDEIVVEGNADQREQAQKLLDDI